jgi:rubredoxin
MAKFQKKPDIFDATYEAVTEHAEDRPTIGATSPFILVKTLYGVEHVIAECANCGWKFENADGNLQYFKTEKEGREVLHTHGWVVGNEQLYCPNCSKTLETDSVTNQRS